MSASPRPGNGASQAVLQVLEQARVVPLITLADANAASPLREALVAAGLPLAEVASALRRRVKPSAGWPVIPGCWSEPGP